MIKEIIHTPLELLNGTMKPLVSETDLVQHEVLLLPVVAKICDQLFELCQNSINIFRMPKDNYKCHRPVDPDHR